MHTPPSRALVQLLGCRGSLPCGGSETLRHGGDTSSLRIRTPDADLLLDAGSGLRNIGKEDLLQEREAMLVLTHFHWDHICGLAHCAPLYRARFALHVAARPRAPFGVLEALSMAHQRPFFPVDPIALAPTPVGERVLNETDSFAWGDLEVDVCEVRHPGGAQAIGVRRGARRLVWIPDVELGDSGNPALQRFCADADLLFLDSHFTCEEYPTHVGWGHSTHRQAARLAAAAGARQLLLTHHAPGRSDAEVERMVEEARAIHPQTAAARQGTSWEF